MKPVFALSLLFSIALAFTPRISSMLKSVETNVTQSYEERLKETSFLYAFMTGNMEPHGNDALYYQQYNTIVNPYQDSFSDAHKKLIELMGKSTALAIGLLKIDRKCLLDKQFHFELQRFDMFIHNKDEENLDIDIRQNRYNLLQAFAAIDDKESNPANVVAAFIRAACEAKKFSTHEFLKLRG